MIDEFDKEYDRSGYHDLLGTLYFLDMISLEEWWDIRDECRKRLEKL